MPQYTEEIVSWSDIIIATEQQRLIIACTILNKKPIIFYGVTISGIAYLWVISNSVFVVIENKMDRYSLKKKFKFHEHSLRKNK